MQATVADGVLTLKPETDLKGDAVHELQELAVKKSGPRTKWETLQVDMQGVESMDLDGVLLLLGMYKEMAERERTLKLIHVAEPLAATMQRFGAPALFEIEVEDGSDD